MLTVEKLSSKGHKTLIFKDFVIKGINRGAPRQVASSKQLLKKKIIFVPSAAFAWYPLRAESSTQRQT